MTRGVRLAIVAIVVLVAAGLLWWRERSAPATIEPATIEPATIEPTTIELAAPKDSDVASVPAPRRAEAGATAPDSVRVKVEVLNASGVRGLGRKATFALRDAGFDVVGFGNAPDTTKQDSTVVLDRSGHPEWAKRVAKALGGARVEARPDSSRYLDVTVLLGTAWRPSPKAFYP